MDNSTEGLFMNAPTNNNDLRSLLFVGVHVECLLMKNDVETGS